MDEWGSYFGQQLRNASGIVMQVGVNGTSQTNVAGTINMTDPNGGSIISTGNLNIQSENNHDLYLNPWGGQHVYVGQAGGNGQITASAFFYNSDQSLKKNIQPLQDSLSKIMQLKGVSFDWKSTGKPSVGLIAQDVEKVYPELVDTNKDTGLKSVEYGNLVAPLIEAVKEQQNQIDDLKAQVKELQNKK
jgi:hypothetical protein